MSEMFVVSAAIGIVCAVFSLAGMAIALGREDRWGMVFACLAAMAVILFLTLMGIEYAGEFWKGRS